MRQHALELMLVNKRLFLLSLMLFALIAELPAAQEQAQKRLVAAAMQRLDAHVRYQPAYVAIDYPNGDVPADTGVCSDVVIRSYRAIGIDLQKRVHEDMKANFQRYPSRRIWGLKRPDANIDHRRVANLQVFFTRFGKSLPITDDGKDYQAGDLVSWMLPGNLPHIGIIVAKRSEDGERPLVVHNIGAGPALEDMLFHYKITGHYRYWPDNLGENAQKR